MLPVVCCKCSDCCWLFDAYWLLFVVCWLSFNGRRLLAVV